MEREGRARAGAPPFWRDRDMMTTTITTTTLTRDGGMGGGGRRDGMLENIYSIVHRPGGGTKLIARAAVVD